MIFSSLPKTLIKIGCVEDSRFLGRVYRFVKKHQVMPRGIISTNIYMFTQTKWLLLPRFPGTRFSLHPIGPYGIGSFGFGIDRFRSSHLTVCRNLFVGTVFRRK